MTSKVLKKWLFSLDRFEFHLRAKMARERTKVLKAAATNYADTGNIPFHLQHKHEQNVKDILTLHYKQVIAHFGEQSLRQLPSLRAKSKKSDFSARMQEWVSTQALLKAKRIARTDFDDIQDAISTGLLEGEGVSAIARNIRDKSSITLYRASVIARTETHNAASFGSIETVKDTAQELGVQVTKQWVATVDKRTREAHAAMRGSEFIPIDEMFEVGGEMMDRPGDTSASPENTINCRCGLNYREA